MGQCRIDCFSWKDQKPTCPPSKLPIPAFRLAQTAQYIEGNPIVFVEFFWQVIKPQAEHSQHIRPMEKSSN